MQLDREIRPVTAKQAQKELSHETILASAARVLRERGIAGMSVSEVMKGAGLTVGGFYAHFTSKEALVNDTLRDAAADMRERLFRGLEAKPAEARAEVVLKRYLNTTHRDASAEGCPFPAVVGEIGTTSPDHGETLGEELAALAAELQRVLPERDGPLAPRQLALALLALMIGGLALSRALRGTLSQDVLRACRDVGIAMTRKPER
jgi:TetR/AcrR family transcriptional regulator, transcriptional repressor for nem operon